MIAQPVPPSRRATRSAANLLLKSRHSTPCRLAPVGCRGPLPDSDVPLSLGRGFSLDLGGARAT